MALIKSFKIEKFLVKICLNEAIGRQGLDLFCHYCEMMKNTLIGIKPQLYGHLQNDDQAQDTWPQVHLICQVIVI